ncbi:MAG: hypothetical protein J0H31_05910 [Alphaproteobacteria bacterium]|nr:hypothetical protein [Alphaproteobacteria bacterium]
MLSCHHKRRPFIRRLASRCVVVSAMLPGAPATVLADSASWSNLPRMQLERQFAGPLQDTIVQRWRDPDDGTVCYIYLPITAQHSSPTESGFVQYGPNIIGTISCLQGGPPKPAQPGAAKKK